VKRVFETYEEADADCDHDTEMVCGVMVDDETARYFVLPRGVDDEVGYERAFEIRHGRSMTGYEKWLRDWVTTREVPA
jgi:hypothetical protein